MISLIAQTSEHASAMQSDVDFQLLLEDIVCLINAL